jgi:hypothetical protein
MILPSTQLTGLCRETAEPCRARSLDCYEPEFHGTSDRMSRKTPSAGRVFGLTLSGRWRPAFLPIVESTWDSLIDPFGPTRVLAWCTTPKKETGLPILNGDLNGCDRTEGSLKRPQGTATSYDK